MPGLSRRSISLILFLPLCMMLCSCATTMTVRNLGWEEFTWNPKDLHITIKTETDSSFMERKTVCLVKNGTLKRFLVPYDFRETMYTEEKTFKDMEVPFPNVMLVIPVKIDPNAKNVARIHKNGLTSFHRTNLPQTYPGSPESVRPVKISPLDFTRLGKPFWYNNSSHWVLCVPDTPKKIDDYYHIPITIVKFGGNWRSPDEPYKDAKYIRNGWMTAYRAAASILPLAFDIPTFPIQVIMLLLLH